MAQSYFVEGHGRCQGLAAHLKSTVQTWTSLLRAENFFFALMNIKKKLERSMDRAKTILRRAMAGVVVLFMAGSAAAARPPGFGIVHVNGNGQWILYSAEQLAKGDKVVVQYPGKAYRSECCISVVVAGGKQEQEDESVSDDQGQEVWRYPLRAGRAEPDLFIGIAIPGVARERVSASGESTVYVENDGKRYTITSCVASEGVNVDLHEGKKHISNLYFSLGYTVEAPTCTTDASN